MATSRSASRRFLGAFSVLVLALAIAPGCLTNAVWEQMGAQKWQREVVSRQAVPPTMRVHIDRHNNTMLLLDAGGTGVADLGIRPCIHGHTGVELLIRPELFRVASANLSGTMSRLEGAYETNQADLIITGAVAPEAWRTFVAPEELPASARRALQADSRSFTEGAPNPGLPEGLQRCANWLRWPKTNSLLPELGSEAELVAFVFLDRNDEERKPDRPRQPARVAPTYPECRDALQASTLYARFQTAAGPRTVRIDPDAFYIVFELEPDRADPTLLAHRSRWQFEPADPGSGADLTTDATLAASIWRGEVARSTTSWPVLVAQVVLTPFTMVADVVYTPAIALIGLCLW